MTLISSNKCSFLELQLRKIKTRFLLVFFMVSFFNVTAQTTSLISDCDDFVAGPNTTWTHVLIATTVDSGVASQAAQTFTINVTSLPVGGANYRVVKTVANGNWFNGNAQALTLGTNTITVSAVSFDRSVKFQFSSGDVEFDALTLNGLNSDCVTSLPPPTTSLINDCNDFVSGPNTTWTHVLVATTIADGAASQAAQTFSINVTSLPVGGANVRVYKTVANGNAFFGNPVALTLCSNSITVPAVTFDRAVKFQFSSGDVEFDLLTLNGDSSVCVSTMSSFSVDVIEACDSYTWIDGNTYTSSNNSATHTLTNSFGCDSIIALDLIVTSSSSSTDVVEVCDSYTWIDGNTYTSSNNTATHILTNSSGCDSVIFLDLTITEINSGVYLVNDSTLQAQSVASGTIYQWVDCNNNFSPINGETNAMFTTQNAGYYAVEVSYNNCSEISDCFTINNVSGLDDLNRKYEITLFPNPTSNDLTISLEGIEVIDVVIVNIYGKVLFQQSGLFDQDRISLSSYVSGTYIVKIITSEGNREIRVTKQ